jgi:hypothetical protein
VLTPIYPNGCVSKQRSCPNRPCREEPRPPFALKPANEAVLKKIQTVAAFTVKNGQKFEDVTRTKQVGNPEFSFLSGGEGEDYYNWLKYATKAGGFLRTGTPPTMHFILLVRPPGCMRGLLRTRIQPTMNLLLLHSAFV